MNCIQNALLNDHELPVKVEAAMALSAFLASQNKAEKIVEPNVSLSCFFFHFGFRLGKCIINCTFTSQITQNMLWGLVIANQILYY